MSINPYAPPRSTEDPLEPASLERLVARRQVRMTTLILLVPASYNLVCFAFSPATNRRVIPLPPEVKALNLVGFVVLIVLIWLLALPVLELVSRGVHALAGRRSPPEEWLRALYASLRPAPFLAVGLAAIWMGWVVAFYRWGMDFYSVSVPVGVASHVLLAGLYAPLFYRWYRLVRNSSRG